MILRTALILTAAGLPGLLSLPLVLPAMPGVPVPLLLVQPALLLLALALAGSWAAPRCGFRLRAPSSGPARLAEAGSGMLLGFCIATADHLARPAWQAGPGLPPGIVEAWTPATLVAGLLYGGVVEEVMLRWGVMSLLVLGLWRVVARRADRPPAGIVLAGMAGAATVFAAGHLPALALAADAPGAGAVLRTLLANAAAGLVFGWLFARRDLLAAMLAHGGAHLGFGAAALAVQSAA